MFVKAEARGSGIASMVITELEKWATEKGFSKAVLETGIKQEAAIRFYAKHGYSIISNYGPYIGNLNSICMNKKL
jgi:ribosomal protein S18 acetylase RimI-like enzyme